ncbi:MAG: hypothetical protein HUJ59_00215 [Bacilli bacterium]|nr:hypothetical protein [Bacilli bacterium]
MKKTTYVFAFVHMILGAVIAAFFSFNLLSFSSNLAMDLAAISNGEERDLANSLPFVILSFIAVVYFVMVTITGLLSKNIVKENRLDKIKPFGILSIIFFNPAGGILMLIYDKQIKKELERTAPKGERKEAKKE